MNRGLHLLWRLPLRYALWLALPLQILVVSVIYDGWAAYARMAAYAKQAMPPFDRDQLLYFTRSELSRNFSRLLAATFPEDDGLETIQLTISREAIGELNLDLPTSGRADYKNAILEVAGDRGPVKARYTGDNHWHWLYPQKSWRIKMGGADPLRNRRAFNIKNAPGPLVIDETVTSEIARDLGLLTPDVRPVKLLINGMYAGSYLWWDIVDESLLRRAHRMPGSIYSGDGAPIDSGTGVSRLWREQKHWQKTDSRNAAEQLDRSEITMLIEAVNDSDPLAFHAFTERHLDFQKFAKFIAMDRAFAGAHHDFHHNHKLYFDPYKSRFEPIEWDFDAWHSTRPITDFDAALNPLLIALRRHPHYEYRLQRTLRDLMATALHPDAVGRRLGRWAAAIAPSLAADGNRDARDWSRSANLRLPFSHCVVFDMATYERCVEEAMRDYQHRHEGLLELLEDAGLDYEFAIGPQRSSGVLDLGSTGHASSIVRTLRVSGRADRASLFRDSNLDGQWDAADALVADARFEDGVATLALDEHVLPGLTKTPRATAADPILFGLDDLVPGRLTYRYFVRADGALDETIELTADNAVTGTAIAISVRPDPTSEGATFSCHPWRLPPRSDGRTVTLGPGDIEITETREFGPETQLEIAAGTTLRLAPGASLLVRGPVHAEGTDAMPIAFTALRPGHPWGVVALHGRATAGSTFRYCRFEDGSTATNELLHHSGMISILDTADIHFASCRVIRNHVGDDAMHWGDVDGGSIQSCIFSGVIGDAVDLDVCRQIRITGCTFEKSGKDLLDLTTCTAEVTDCTFHFGGNAGISVGEGSTVVLTRSEFVGCSIGVEVKDQSLLRTGAGVSLRDCGIGIDLLRKNTRYGLGGTIEGTPPQYSGSGVLERHDRRSAVRLDERAEAGAHPVR